MIAPTYKPLTPSSLYETLDKLKDLLKAPQNEVYHFNPDCYKNLKEKVRDTIIEQNAEAIAGYEGIRFKVSSFVPEGEIWITSIVDGKPKLTRMIIEKDKEK